MDDDFGKEMGEFKKERAENLKRSLSREIRVDLGIMCWNCLNTVFPGYCFGFILWRER